MAAEVCVDTFAFSEFKEITDSHVDKVLYSIELPSSPIKLDLATVENLISKPGIYLVSGSYSDTRIRINSTGNGAVRLVLDGLRIDNTSSPAIWVENLAQTDIHLSPNSVNSLISTSVFSRQRLLYTQSRQMGIY